jgi:hypothetical protein
MEGGEEALEHFRETSRDRLEEFDWNMIDSVRMEVDPIISIFLKTDKDDDGSANATDVASSDGEDEPRGHGVTCQLYNGNVLPTATTRGQTSLYAEFERGWPEEGAEEFLFSRLYREPL